MKKQLIKELKKFYYAPTDLIPNLDLIRTTFDDEFNHYLYVVDIDKNGRYKFMQDLTQNQQDFINKRFAILEKSKNRKFDKFPVQSNINTLEDELRFRRLKFESILIDRKNKKVVVLNSKHTKGRIELDEQNLISTIKSEIRTSCSRYLQKYEIVLKYSEGFVEY